jgi:hypothetical protein
MSAQAAVQSHATPVNRSVPKPAVKIAAPTSTLERDADRIAEIVMRGGTVPEAGQSPRGPSTPIYRKCAACAAGGPACEACAEEEATLHLKAQAGAAQGAAPGSSQTARAAAAVQSGGHPLPRSLSNYFTPRLGSDLSQVRVHTDLGAGRAARAINARAYTLGQHIAFAPGQYAPQTHEGRRLIAHELAHTLQDTRGTSRGQIARELDESACSLEGDQIRTLQLEQQRIAEAGGATWEDLERDHPSVASATREISALYNSISASLASVFAEAGLTPSRSNDVWRAVAWEDRIERTQQLMEQTNSFTAPHLSIWVGQILHTLDAFDSALAQLAERDSANPAFWREQIADLVRNARSLCNNAFLTRGAMETREAAELQTRERLIEARVERIRRFVRSARRSPAAVGIHGNQVARILARDEPVLSTEEIIAVLDRLEEIHPDLLNEALYEGRTIQQLLDMGHSGFEGFYAGEEGFLSGFIRAERESLAADPAEELAFSPRERAVVVVAFPLGLFQGIGDSLISNIKAVVELFTPEFWSDLMDFLSDFLPDFLMSSEFRYQVGQLAGRASAAEIRELASDSPFDYGRKFGWFFGYALTETVLSVIGLGWVLKSLRGTRVMAQVSRTMTQLLSRIARGALAARGLSVVTAMTESLMALRRRIRAIERRFPALTADARLRRAIADISPAEQRLGETLERARTAEREARGAISSGELQDARTNTRVLSQEIDRAEAQADAARLARDTPERPASPSETATEAAEPGPVAEAGRGGGRGSGGGGEGGLLPTGGDTAPMTPEEMYRTMTAQTAFREGVHGGELLRHGSATRAIIQLIDRDGRRIAVTLGSNMGGRHAEQVALRRLRAQIDLERRFLSRQERRFGREAREALEAQFTGVRERLRGGRLEVVVNQDICGPVCQRDLRAFAERYGLARVDGYVFERPGARPRQTFRTQTSRAVEGEPLQRVHQPVVTPDENR